MTKVLNVYEVAEILGLKPARVYQMTRDKCLPFVLLGERQYRWSRSAIEIYIRCGANQETPNIEENNNESKYKSRPSNRARKADAKRLCRTLLPHVVPGVLDMYIVESPSDARSQTEKRLEIYNHRRTHDSLGGIPPSKYLTKHNTGNVYS